MICERLDGIPLAIELAAARVRNISVDRIAGGLDDRFRLLRGGSTTLLPRQQTLLESIEWSHQLLDDGRAGLFRRLALFSGGFGLDAAEAVAPSTPSTPTTCSTCWRAGGPLARRARRRGPADRYRLLETIKQFARARLEEAGEVGRCSTGTSPTSPRSPPRSRPISRPARSGRAGRVLEREGENLRVALVHAATLDDPDRARRPRVGPRPLLVPDRAVRAGRPVDAHRGRGRRRTRTPSSEPACSGARGFLNYYFGDFALSGELAQAAMDAGVAVDDPVARSGDGPRRRPRAARRPLGSVPSLEDALALARAAGDRWGEIDILQKIGFSYLYADRYDDAARSFDAAP